MAGAHFDTSQVDRLAADLTQAPIRLQRKAQGVMKKGALEILREMRSEFSGHGHAPYVQGSFEMEPRGQFGWEIGELDSGGPQWGIAHILAYGTSNNAPVADHRKALRGEVPKIMDHLGDAAEDSVLGGGE